jgi:hypothetical protein
MQYRGDELVHDENTMDSFRLAVEWGMGFECDVRSSSDGVPVVVHDDTLWRTHGKPWWVCRTQAADLMAYNVPTVEEVVAEFPHTPIVFDVKDEKCIPKVVALCRLLPGKTLLHWQDDWECSPEVPCLRAREYVFPPETSRLGVACKFNDSEANRTSIEKALAAGNHVNLYASGANHKRSMLRLYGCNENCSFTL